MALPVASARSTLAYRMTLSLPDAFVKVPTEKYALPQVVTAPADIEATLPYCVQILVSGATSLPANSAPPMASKTAPAGNWDTSIVRSWVDVVLTALLIVSSL